MAGPEGCDVRWQGPPGSFVQEIQVFFVTEESCGKKAVFLFYFGCYDFHYFPLVCCTVKAQFASQRRKSSDITTHMTAICHNTSTNLCVYRHVCNRGIVASFVIELEGTLKLSQPPTLRVSTTGILEGLAALLNHSGEGTQKSNFVCVV